MVSTPEATAVDLVGYQHRAGGLAAVATVLAELAEQIDPEKFPIAAGTAPVAWVQRLGYLLELSAPTRRPPTLGRTCGRTPASQRSSCRTRRTGRLDVTRTGSSVSMRM
jgi:hypothetical protein